MWRFTSLVQAIAKKGSFFRQSQCSTTGDELEVSSPIRPRFGREGISLALVKLFLGTTVAFGLNLRSGSRPEGTEVVREGNSLASEKIVPWHHGSLWTKLEKWPHVPRGQRLSDRVTHWPWKNCPLAPRSLWTKLEKLPHVKFRKKF